MTAHGIVLVEYEPRLESAWDQHVRSSRNGTFLIERSYMEYHSDRFTDASILALSSHNNEILAVLPANQHLAGGGAVLASHGGLTYGGWITSDRVTASTMLEIFALLREYIVDRGYRKLIYKPVPRIFHTRYADEDQYALFMNDASLIRVEAGSAIDLLAPLPWNKGKKHSLSKSRRAGISVELSHDFDRFIELVELALVKHNARPTHTASELALLSGRFPENIKLYFARMPSRDPVAVCSAVLVFDAGAALHCQYIASNEHGRAHGGVEAIIDHLLRTCCVGKRALSFGISTEQAGRYLNSGLQAQKEGFGARLVPHYLYEMAV